MIKIDKESVQIKGDKMIVGAEFMTVVEVLLENNLMSEEEIRMDFENAIKVQKKEITFDTVEKEFKEELKKFLDSLGKELDNLKKEKEN